MAHEFLDFVNKSPSPFHAVDSCIKELEKAGYTRLSELEVWSELKPGGLYFVTRNQSALVAFAIGEKYEPGNGFTIAAAHTDSPCLKLKPISAATKSGFDCIGTQWYGGGIWRTWFDRDLSVAGRVLFDDPSTGGVSSALADVKRPIVRIPSLAIHLDRGTNDKFAVDKEAHLWAVMATHLKESLGTDGTTPDAKDSGTAAGGGGTEGSSGSGSATPSPYKAGSRHHPELVRLIAEAVSEGRPAGEAAITPEAIRDFELCMYDTQDGAVGGTRREFIFAARLDNLLMSFACIKALNASIVGGSLAQEKNVRVVGLFDNEEVGSASVPGAGSTFLGDVMRRIHGEDKPKSWPVSMRKSILVSADMAHAAHPNYGDRHDCNHRPAMQAGLVIKTNCNERYSTTAVTATMVRRAAEASGVPIQEFAIKQDIGCGSTIGPIMSTRLGVRTVDVGVAQLSMHSIREMCGVQDIDLSIRLMAEIYRTFPALDESTKGTE